MRFASPALLLFMTGCGVLLDLDPPDLVDAGAADAGGGGADASMDAAVDAGRDAGCAADACVPSFCGDHVVDPGEECDDGNAISHDGCEPGCTFTCVGDAQCDDGDACTLDACLPSHTCAPTSTLVCRPDACHLSSGCDATLGCVYDLIDGDGDGHAPSTLGACGDDCNDDASGVHPGATETCDGIDEDCNGLIDDGAGRACGRDADGDRFGSSSDVVMDCVACPPGYVLDVQDCWDETAMFASLAHPGQRTYFLMPRGPTSAPSYDWNCDGVEEPSRPSVAFVTCSPVPPVGSTCDTQSGWVSAVPLCGATGDYQPCFTDTAGNCVLGPLSHPQQACR